MPSRQSWRGLSPATPATSPPWPALVNLMMVAAAATILTADLGNSPAGLGSAGHGNWKAEGDKTKTFRDDVVEKK